MKLKKFFTSRNNILIAVVFIIVIFFNKFFLSGLHPAPLDIITGMYFPYLNHDWGNPTGVPVKNPLMSDIVSIILEWRYLAIDSIKNFQIPFWNPYSFLGTPLFANFQNSLLNISNIFFLLPVSFIQAWSLSIISQFIFCLVITYYYLINRKISPLSSLLGSFVFTFNLFSIVWSVYGIHLYVATFLPLSLLFIDKYFKSHKNIYLKFLSISICLQIFGGYPQYVIYSLMLIVFYLFFFYRHQIKGIYKTFIAIILGLLISTPLLLPGYQLTNLSIRDYDNTATNQNNGFIPIQNILTLISPNFFGNPATYDYQGQNWYDNNVIYPGVFAIISSLGLLLSIHQISRRYKKLVVFSFIIIIFCFLNIFNNPLSLFLKNNFGLFFTSGGISTKIFILAIFSFSILSATCLDQIKKINIKKACFIVSIWFLSIILLNNFNILQSTVGQKNTLYQIFFFLIIFISVLLNKIKLTTFLIILVTFFESYYLFNKYVPFTPAKYFFPTTESIQYLIDNSSTYRISTSTTIPQNMWAMYKLKSADGYDTLLPRKTYYHLQMLDSYQPRTSTDATRASTYHNFNSPGFQQLSIKYFLTNNITPFTNYNQEHKTDRFKIALTEKDTAVVEDLQVFPRARLSKVIYSSEQYDFLKNTDPYIVHTTNSLIIPFLDQINDCQSNTDAVIFLQDDPNIIKISTSSPCPRLLVLYDSNYPGWQSYVNDQKSDLITVNYNFKSVIIPPGDNLVKFVYTPTNFNLYLILSLISIFITFIWL